MRAQFFLIPAVTVCAAQPAAADEAETYLSVGQAQQLLFPGATFRPDFFDLRDAEFDLIRDTAKVTQWVRYIRAWRVSTGGWFLVDQVPGRDDMIRYAIGLSADGQVVGIEILTCLRRFDNIRNPAWRRQMVGARRGTYQPDRVRTISGVTLSSKHVAGGVKRVLVTYDLFLKNRR
jgi:hypothetical protein